MSKLNRTLAIKELIESGRDHSELVNSCPVSKRAGMAQLSPVFYLFF